MEKKNVCEETKKCLFCLDNGELPCVELINWYITSAAPTLLSEQKIEWYLCGDMKVDGRYIYKQIQVDDVRKVRVGGTHFILQLAGKTDVVDEETLKTIKRRADVSYLKKVQAVTHIRVDFADMDAFFANRKSLKEKQIQLLATQIGY